MSAVAITSVEDLETHIKAAKAYLLRSSCKPGVTLYDHLVDILKSVLDKKPTDINNLLEEYSWQEKKRKFQHQNDFIQDKQKITSEVILAKAQQKLFKKSNIQDDVEEEVLPDIMTNAFYFEQAGVGLGREETFSIFLAIKQLTDTYKLKSCRFWGKMYGTKANYIIAEVQFKDNEDHFRESIDLNQEENYTPSQSVVIPASPDLASNNESDQDLKIEPKNDFKTTVEIPHETYGEGCNSNVYYVCNEAGLEWHRLPMVTPMQIQVSRKIRKLLTGDLNAEVVSYPPFPGVESNYLRAIIARISGATHISPQGYYIFEEDDDDDDDEDTVKTTFMKNPEFEGLPINDLCEPTNAFWVHHTHFVLPQGRTTWYDTSAEKVANETFDDDEMDEDDEQEEEQEVEPEEGLPLLTVLSEDQEVNNMIAWTATRTASSFPQFSIASMQSNLWPGAYAFAVDKSFENVYIGWGLKYSADNYSPPAPPPAQDEYPSGADVTECDDPSVEQEKAVLAAQQDQTDDEDDDDDDDDEEEGSEFED